MKNIFKNIGADFSAISSSIPGCIAALPWYCIGFRSAIVFGIDCRHCRAGGIVVGSIKAVPQLKVSGPAAGLTASVKLPVF